MREIDSDSYMTKLGFRRSTEVQKAVFDKILDGKDLFVQAPTGSGKTAAYLAPLFERYREVRKENKILVLVPTHELALQVSRTANQIAAAMNIPLRNAVIVGDAGIGRQMEKLKEKPEIIIGTATRIHELIKKRKIAAHLIKSVVLDEGDRLFDEDNIYMTNEVIRCFMRDRQLLLFTATLTGPAVSACEAWTDHAEVIKTNEGREIPENVKHWYVVCEKRDKIEVLRGVTGATRTKKALIFVNGPDGLIAYEKLRFHHYDVAYIGGKRTKEERKEAMKEFSEGKVKYLIATDLAARGLQFDNVDTVFHVSMPEEPTFYLHRAGRTGRAGNVGRNLSIITKKELPLIRKYEKALNIKFERKYYYDGKLMDRVKNQSL